MLKIAKTAVNTTYLWSLRGKLQAETAVGSFNSQQSTVNSQQSTVNSQQSTVNSQQSTVNSQLYTSSS